MILILGGIAVLLNQFNLVSFELNWRALFILFPAAGFFSGAYNRYRSHNNLFAMDVMFPVLLGLFMVALWISFLSGIFWNINWSMLWPIILIIIGRGSIFSCSQRE